MIWVNLHIRFYLCDAFVHLSLFFCAWSIIFITRDLRFCEDTRDQSHVPTPEQSCSSFCAWSIIFITLDQRCLVDTPDQSHVSTSEQSCSLFEFDQSFLSRLISVNPGRRMINHMCPRLNNHVPHLRLINQFYCAWSTLFRGHAWSITCTYAWTVMFLIYAWSIISITPDQCN